MIIQGDNHPSIIVLDEDLSGMERVSCALCTAEEVLKTWTKEEMTFTAVDDGYAISIPWTQEETAALPAGPVVWELKALDRDGLTQFWDTNPDAVISRKNREVLE